MNHFRDNGHEACFIEDLCVFERRGELTGPERRRLQMALGASESLQSAHQLGKDFDALSTDCSDDTALVDDLVRAARTRYVGPKAVSTGSRTRRVVSYAALLSLFPLSAAAGAALWPYAQALVVEPRPSSRAVVQVEPVAKRFPRYGVNAVPATSKPQTETDWVPTAATAKARFNSRAAVTLPEASLEETKSAAELFSAANQARRQGAVATAKAYYQELAERFPTAEQTALSYVLLARIDLQNGQAMAARRKFDEYLRLSPTGVLAQEALQGCAESYRRLGMQREELDAWQKLLRSYPQSLYKQAAEARLRELQN